MTAPKKPAARPAVRAAPKVVQLPPASTDAPEVAPEPANPPAPDAAPVDQPQQVEGTPAEQLVQSVGEHTAEPDQTPPGYRRVILGGMSFNVPLEVEDPTRVPLAAQLSRIEVRQPLVEVVAAAAILGESTTNARSPEELTERRQAQIEALVDVILAVRALPA